MYFEYEKPSVNNISSIVKPIFFFGGGGKELKSTYALGCKNDDFRAYILFEWPLVPFLYQDILDILYVLMSRFLNQVILAPATTRKKILNVNVMYKQVWCPVKDVDNGIAAASKLLKKSC